MKPYSNRSRALRAHRSIRRAQQQRGVALIVALILLVVITVIGLAAIRLSTMQEKMAGNTFDRAQAFQVAEATLQLASTTILPPAPLPDSTTYNVNGVTNCADAPCLDNPANQVGVSGLPDIATAAWTLPPTATNPSGGTANIISLYGNIPSYIIQYMGQCSVDGGGNFQFTNDENNQGGGGSLKTAGKCYRITARSSTPGAAGAPAQDRAQVTLQAIYRTS